MDKITVEFDYNKRQVIQGLRYHFLSRPEIRIMIIVVNVFALLSAILFYLKAITPLAFLVGSTLWFVLMITFWFLLPGAVYRKAATFKDHFVMNFEAENFTVGNERGSRSWSWATVSKFVETPNFFHLYFDSRSFFLVPKEAFVNTDDVYKLRQLIKSKVRSKR